MALTKRRLQEGNVGLERAFPWHHYIDRFATSVMSFHQWIAIFAWTHAHGPRRARLTGVHVPAPWGVMCLGL